MSANLLFTDDFQRADGDLGAGLYRHPDGVFRPMRWRAYTVGSFTGIPTVTSSALVIPRASEAWVPINAYDARVTFTLSAQSSNRSFMVMLRHADPNTMFFAEITSTTINSKWLIDGEPQPSGTTVGTAGGLTISNGDSFAVEVSYNTMTVHQNDTLRLTATLTGRAARMMRSHRQHSLGLYASTTGTATSHTVTSLRVYGDANA